MRRTQPRAAILRHPRSTAAIALYMALIISPGMIIGTFVALSGLEL